MRRQAVRDTLPELLLRRRLHAAGLRYRVHLRPIAHLRRNADIVFTRARVVVFVDGCFWHSCPDHGTRPRANADWWHAKLARNGERDAETTALLADAGWLVLRIWEHEDPADAALRIETAVRARSTHGRLRSAAVEKALKA